MGLAAYVAFETWRMRRRNTDPHVGGDIAARSCAASFLESGRRPRIRKNRGRRREGVGIYRIQYRKPIASRQPSGVASIK